MNLEELNKSIIFIEHQFMLILSICKACSLKMVAEFLWTNLMVHLNTFCMDNFHSSCESTYKRPVIVSVIVSVDLCLLK